MFYKNTWKTTCQIRGFPRCIEISGVGPLTFKNCHMESPFRFIFVPIGFVLFFAFLMAGLMFSSLSLVVGAFGFVRGQLALSARTFLFS